MSVAKGGHVVWGPRGAQARPQGGLGAEAQVVVLLGLRRGGCLCGSRRQTEPRVRQWGTHLQRGRARRKGKLGGGGPHPSAADVQPAVCAQSQKIGNTCTPARVMLRSWPTLAKPTLAKPTLANFSTDFGQTDFGQFWCCSVLAKFSGCCCCVVVVLCVCGGCVQGISTGPPSAGPPSAGPPSAGPPSAGPPSARPPKILLFFFPSPTGNVILSSLSWGSFSWNFGGVFEAPGRSNVHVWSSRAVVCEPRRPGLVGPPGFHTTTREPKRPHFKVPVFKNTTKIPRKRPNKREKRMKTVAGGVKKSAKFWAPHPSGPHRSGPHRSGPQPFWAPTLLGPTSFLKLLFQMLHDVISVLFPSLPPSVIDNLKSFFPFFFPSSRTFLQCPSSA